MPTRRHVLRAGGGLAAGLILPAGLIRPSAAEDVIEIHMGGRPDGSAVWFDPIGILVRPGQTIRWINSDPGNSHTATAYHPLNDNHPLRIPETAQPWNSDYLLPNEHFEVTLTVDGVYDYFCIPHEQAGMVGRLIVGSPSGPGAQPFDRVGRSNTGQAWLPVPEAAQKAFPDIQEILARKVVRRA
jgi:plastocyanin